MTPLNMRRARQMLLPMVLLPGARDLRGQSVPTRTVVEAFRVGGPSAPDPFAFSEPPALVVDAAGMIYARLTSEGTVLVLRATASSCDGVDGAAQGPVNSAWPRSTA